MLMKKYFGKLPEQKTACGIGSLKNALNLKFHARKPSSFIGHTVIVEAMLQRP
jgi:hypothetical protein